MTDDEYTYPPDEWGYHTHPWDDPQERQAAWDALSPVQRNTTTHYLRQLQFDNKKRRLDIAASKARNPEWEQWEAIIRGLADTERDVQIALSNLARNWNTRPKCNHLLPPKTLRKIELDNSGKTARGR